MSTSDAERAASYEDSIRIAIQGALTSVWTALPGEIVSYDAARQTAVVQPTIQAQIADPAGKTTLQTLPLLLDCPVQFQQGGGCVLTFPIAAGDECMVVFFARCMDSWWFSGGIQPQAELRMHDLSDGVVLVGVRSLPNAIGGVSTTATELRAVDGHTKISLDPTAQTVGITAPGGTHLTANVLITGNLHVTGTITGDGEADFLGPLKVNGVTVTVP